MNNISTLKEIKKATIEALKEVKEGEEKRYKKIAFIGLILNLYPFLITGIYNFIANYIITSKWWGAFDLISDIFFQLIPISIISGIILGIVALIKTKGRSLVAIITISTGMLFLFTYSYQYL